MDCWIFLFWSWSLGGGQWEFLFFCSFSLFCGSFWKFQKEHQIWEQLKEKLAKLLLFHADSQTLVKVDNQHKTAANKHFLTLKGVQASSQQCKQTNKQTPLLACYFTKHTTYLVCKLLPHGHHDIAWLPSQVVSFNPNIQKHLHILLITLQFSWINNVDDFFSKNVQKYSKMFINIHKYSKIFKNIQKYSTLFRSESCFLRSRKTRKMLWIMLPRFPAGAGTREIGSKRKGKRGKEEFLKGKCNQGPYS